MKNIHEILKEYGMEVPADKKADFDKAWKENYRTKSEYDNAVTQRDNYKACKAWNRGWDWRYCRWQGLPDWDVYVKTNRKYHL